MKTMQRFVVFVCAVVLLAACTPPAANAPANANSSNANANVASNPAMPSVEALTALQTKSVEAWKNKDAKYWDNFLADNFVSLGPGGKRMGKADLVKMMADDKCEMKSYSLSDQHVTPIGTDAVVLTSKVTSDYTCGGQAGPSPAISASVYERSGNEWKGAYYNEVVVKEPKNTKADEKKPDAPAAKTAESPAAPDAKAAGSPAAPVSGDALTDSLMALEKSGWEAWKDHDAKKLGDLTGADLAFVNSVGHFMSNKADTIKSWTGPACEVKSVNVSDGKATMITKDAAILTFKGSADGTCEGAPVGAVWGTSFYVKDGDTWKMVYGFENPA